METPHAFFSKLVLILCLSLYGPSAMPMTTGNTFLMKICADGEIETAHLDAIGVPIDSTDTCNNCLTCCQSPEAVALVASFADQPPTVCSGTARLARLFDHFVQYTDSRPLPRGLPAVPDLQLTVPDAIRTDRNGYGYGMRCTGQPDFKDAVA